MTILTVHRLVRYVVSGYGTTYYYTSSCYRMHKAFMIIDKTIQDSLGTVKHIHHRKCTLKIAKHFV